MARELSARTRRDIIHGQFLGPAVAIVLIWIAYVLSLFGYEFVGFGQRLAGALGGGRREGLGSQTWLYIALAITPLALAWGVFYSRRALHLARNGTVVRASVSPEGRNTVNGEVLVHYDYPAGKRFVHKTISCKPEDAEAYRSGEKPLLILVDPKRPGRSIRFSDLLPGEPLPKFGGDAESDDEASGDDPNRKPEDGNWAWLNRHES